MTKIDRQKRLPIVGWREWAGLPELGIERIKVKIDTGAQTSALHAFRLEPFVEQGAPWVRFFAHPVAKKRHPEIECFAPVADRRMVTSSNGQRELRYVIETALRLAGREWKTELTLTSRDEMSFRMLVGRKALRGHVLVDPGSSYLFGRQKKLRTPK